MCKVLRSSRKFCTMAMLALLLPSCLSGALHRGYEETALERRVVSRLRDEHARHASSWPQRPPRTSSVTLKPAAATAAAARAGRAADVPTPCQSPPPLASASAAASAAPSAALDYLVHPGRKYNYSCWSRLRFVRYRPTRSLLVPCHVTAPHSSSHRGGPSSLSCRRREAGFGRRA